MQDDSPQEMLLLPQTRGGVQGTPGEWVGARGCGLMVECLCVSVAVKAEEGEREGEGRPKKTPAPHARGI